MRIERSRLLVRGLGAQRVESSASRATGGHNEQSRLPIKGLVGGASGVVSSGRGTGERNERSRLPVEGLVGATSGVVCWSWDWWAHRAESFAGHGTGGRIERSRLLVMGLVGAASGVVCWSWGLLRDVGACGGWGRRVRRAAGWG